MDIKAPRLTLSGCLIHPRLRFSFDASSALIQDGSPPSALHRTLARHLAFAIRIRRAGTARRQFGADQKLPLARADRLTRFSAAGLRYELSFGIDHWDPCQLPRLAIEGCNRGGLLKRSG